MCSRFKQASGLGRHIASAHKHVKFNLADLGDVKKCPLCDVIFENMASVALHAQLAHKEAGVSRRDIIGERRRVARRNARETLCPMPNCTVVVTHTHYTFIWYKLNISFRPCNVVFSG